MSASPRSSHASANLLVTIDGGKVTKLVDADSDHELTIVDSRLDRRRSASERRAAAHFARSSTLDKMLPAENAIAGQSAGRFSNEPFLQP